MNPYMRNPLKMAIAAGIASMLLQPVFAGVAEDVKSAMQLLESKAMALGPATIEGEEDVAGKMVPGLYFGDEKMNNNFALVDEIQSEMGGTATIFVKSSDEYVRVATNVKKDDGSRAVGTILDPDGKVIQAINKDQPFYGDVEILGKPYTTGYEPIHDASGNVIGIYYVGYPKE